MSGFQCRIEADSVSAWGCRLTTFVVRFPRFTLAQFNTHRVLSRNARSSRAVPVSIYIKELEEHPFIPVLSERGPGMSSNVPVDDATQKEWREDVASLRDAAIAFARKWSQRGHKQHVNRYLEPWAWVDVVASGTDWKGFWALRDHPDAQPEFQQIASMMKDAYLKSTPSIVRFGEWHLPFTTPEERRYLATGTLHALSVGRLRRVSYGNHDGTCAREKDLAGFRSLIEARPPHASPFEHVATPGDPGYRTKGNFMGWAQLRHDLLPEPGE